MAATVLGTAHLYGITAGVGAITNATVLSFNVTDEHANRAQTVNEIGNEIEDRFDDLHKTGTITLRIRAAYTVASAASTITYNGETYVITSVERAEEAQGFVTVTYNIQHKEYISVGS